MAFFTAKDLVYDSARGLRIFGSHNFVIHCHHYNARLEKTICTNDAINGREIFKSSARVVFSDLIKNIKEEKKVKSPSEVLKMATELYSFLGFGVLHLEDVNSTSVEASVSHFVKGWTCGSLKTKGCVCLFTEAFIEASYEHVGRKISCTEIECMNEEKPVCRFEFKMRESESKEYLPSFKVEEVRHIKNHEQSSNIDKEKIIQAVAQMEIVGNEEGLIPAFNVYLANMPQDFYNLVAVHFVNELEKVGLGSVAAQMLYEDAENCALNTFGGILHSEEWAGLIDPMVKEDSDKIHGLIAVANALGWGLIGIEDHSPRESLSLITYNGYESFGYWKLLGEKSKVSRCHMLRGITAGLVGLIYETGELEDRSGIYSGTEENCITTGHSICRFHAKK